MRNNVKQYLKHILKEHRPYVLWGGSVAVVAWFYFTEKGPSQGEETHLRLQLLFWGLVLGLPVYLMRKALMPGDSRALLKEAREGNVGSAIVWAAMALLTGILFLAFAMTAHAEPPPASLQHLPVLRAEATSAWPDVPGVSNLAGQIEQETCPALTSKKCWNPHTELKTDREYGFGLGQITVTSRFNNFDEARKNVSMRDWRWEDRFNARYQLRTLILTDRGNYHRLSFVENPLERLAMALVAYNGGLGGLLSDRRLCAATKGCDPNVWFGNVERTSLKAKTAARGYGKSFFEINREYPRNILGFRREHYATWFGEV